MPKIALTFSWPFLDKQNLFKHYYILKYISIPLGDTEVTTVCKNFGAGWHADKRELYKEQ